MKRWLHIAATLVLLAGCAKAPAPPPAETVPPPPATAPEPVPVNPADPAGQ